MEDIKKLKEKVCIAIENAAELSTLEAIRIAELGKNGRITVLMKTLGQIDPAERKKVGQQFNELKNTISGLIEKRKLALEVGALEHKLAEEGIDVTLPVRPQL